MKSLYAIVICSVFNMGTSNGTFYGDRVLNATYPLLVTAVQQDDVKAAAGLLKANEKLSWVTDGPIGIIHHVRSKVMFETLLKFDPMILHYKEAEEALLVLSTPLWQELITSPLFAKSLKLITKYKLYRYILPRLQLILNRFLKDPLHPELVCFMVTNIPDLMNRNFADINKYADKTNHAPLYQLLLTRAILNHLVTDTKELLTKDINPFVNQEGEPAYDIACKENKRMHNSATRQIVKAIAACMDRPGFWGTLGLNDAEVAERQRVYGS